MAFNVDDVAVYERLRADPRATFSEIARLESWRMKNGQPYHVKVARIVRTLERHGCIRREKSATVPRGLYVPIRAPSITDSQSAPAPKGISQSAAQIAASKGHIWFRGRYLRNAADVWHAIRQLAFIARKLPHALPDTDGEPHERDPQDT